MPRATIATQSTGLDLECGTAGLGYDLTGVQPAGFTFEFDAFAGGIPRCVLNYWAAKAAASAAGNTQAASAGLADCGTSFAVTIDGEDYLAGPVSISLDTQPKWFRAASADKGANERRFADCVMLGNDVWSARVSTALKIPDSVIDILLDTVDQGIELIATGAGISFTLSNLVSPPQVIPWQGDNGIVWYQYDFTSLPGFGKGYATAL